MRMVSEEPRESEEMVRTGTQDQRKYISVVRVTRTLRTRTKEATRRYTSHLSLRYLLGLNVKWGEMGRNDFYLFFCFGWATATLPILTVLKGSFSRLFPLQIFYFSDAIYHQNCITVKAQNGSRREVAVVEVAAEVMVVLMHIWHSPKLLERRFQASSVKRQDIEETAHFLSFWRCAHINISGSVRSSVVGRSVCLSVHPWRFR